MTQLPEVISWFPDECLRSIGDGASTTAIAVAVGLAATAWIGGKASSAIVSEYAKRTWFSKVHQSIVQKGFDELNKAKENYRIEKQEFDGLRIDINTLIDINNSLRARIHQLEHENASYRHQISQKPARRSQRQSEQTH